MPSLCDLINDNSFWDFDDLAASSMVESASDGIDYFEPFDDGCFTEDIDLPKIYLKLDLIFFYLIDSGFLVR